MRSKINLLFFFLVSPAVFLVYFKTLAPTVTWSHFGEEGPKLLTQIVISPFSIKQSHLPYLAVAKFFLLLNSYFPLLGPDPAFLVNLVSAIFASLTVGLVFLILVSLSKTPLAISVATRHLNLNFLPAIFASLIFAFSPTFWSQAVITEVSTFNIFLVALIVFFMIQNSRKFAPTFLSFLVLAINFFPFSWRDLTFRSASEILANLETTTSLVLENFSGAILILALIGILWGFDSGNFLRFLFPLIVLAQATIDSLFKMATVSPFYLPSFLVISILSGLGIKIFLEIVLKLLQSELAVSFENRFFLIIFRFKEAGKLLRYATFLLLAFWLTITPLNLLKTTWPKVDLSQNWQTYNFGQEIFEALPKNSLLIVETQRFFNTLEYFQKVKRKRGDATLVPAGKNTKDLVAKTIEERPVFFVLVASPIPTGETKGRWNSYALVSKGPLYQVLPL